MSEMQIDYIAVTILCHKILLNKSNMLSAKFGYSSNTAVSLGVSLSFMVWDILDQTWKSEQRTRGAFDGGPYLKSVRDVFEATVEAHLEDEEYGLWFLFTRKVACYFLQ